MLPAGDKDEVECLVCRSICSCVPLVTSRQYRPCIIPQSVNKIYCYLRMDEIIATKHVVLIVIIHKIIIVASSWLFLLLYQWCTVTRTSNLIQRFVFYSPFVLFNMPCLSKQDHMVGHLRCVIIKYIWLNQLSNTTTPNTHEISYPHPITPPPNFRIKDARQM